MELLKWFRKSKSAIEKNAGVCGGGYGEFQPEELPKLEGKFFKESSSDEILFSSTCKPWYYNDETRSFRLHGLGFIWGQKPLMIKLVNDIPDEILNCKTWDDDGIDLYGVAPSGIIEEELSLGELIGKFNNLP